MPNLSRSVRRLALLLLCAAAAVAPLGCRPGDDIEHYQAPRVETPMLRLRVAVFKNGDHTWFFKIMGPKDMVDEHADEFEDFLRSVTFAKDEKEPVKWKAPDGWEREPAGQPIYAKYVVGPKDSAAEITVTRLGAQAGSLLANVNRWREQLGLKPIAEDALNDNVSKEKIGDQEVTRVDLSAAGRLRKTPVGKLPIGKEPPETELKYDTPEGWQKMAQPPAFAKVGFQVGEARRQAAVVSITPLGPQPMLANVNRWRSQVGLDEIKPGQLNDVVKPFEVGEAKAQAVDFTGPQGRLLVVLLPHGDGTWIFKMMGSPDLVAKQKPVFEKFVRSVRFEGGSDE
jgi:hypothetical protein